MSIYSQGKKRLNKTIPGMYMYMYQY